MTGKERPGRSACVQRAGAAPDKQSPIVQVASVPLERDRRSRPAMAAVVAGANPPDSRLALQLSEIHAEGLPQVQLTMHMADGRERIVASNPLARFSVLLADGSETQPISAAADAHGVNERCDWPALDMPLPPGFQEGILKVCCLASAHHPSVSWSTCCSGCSIELLLLLHRASDARSAFLVFRRRCASSMRV